MESDPTHDQGRVRLLVGLPQITPPSIPKHHGTLHARLVYRVSLRRCLRQLESQLVLVEVDLT